MIVFVVLKKVSIAFIFEQGFHPKGGLSHSHRFERDEICGKLKFYVRVVTAAGCLWIYGRYSELEETKIFLMNYHFEVE